MKATDVLHQPALARPRLRQRRHRFARLAARVRSPRLDPQLAAGIPAWQSPSHAARALQLTSERHRRALARSLERLLEDTERTPTPFRGAVILPCREQVRDALPLILALAARLRDPAPVEVRGIAQLHTLLSDGAGPCYRRIRPGALTVALQAVSGHIETQT
jgi:hypothetical protein